MWYALALAYILLTSFTGEGIAQATRIEWVIYVAMLFYLTVPDPVTSSVPIAPDRDLRLEEPRQRLRS